MHAQSGRWPKNTTLIFLHQILTERFIDACAPEENEKKLSGLSDEDRAMAWKQLRSSTLSAKWRSMCTGALIPLLTATVIGVLYIITYVCYQTIYNCQFHDTETIPEKAQWIRTIWCHRLCFPALVVLWRRALTFSTISGNGVKRETVLCSFSSVFFGCNLSCGSSTPWDIAF